MVFNFSKVCRRELGCFTLCFMGFLLASILLVSMYKPNNPSPMRQYNAVILGVKDNQAASISLFYLVEDYLFSMAKQCGHEGAFCNAVHSTGFALPRPYSGNIHIRIFSRHHAVVGQFLKGMLGYLNKNHSKTYNWNKHREWRGDRLLSFTEAPLLPPPSKLKQYLLALGVSLLLAFLCVSIREYYLRTKGVAEK
jgi:hypothetical protein